MAATILNGTWVAEEHHALLKTKVQAYKETTGRFPSLAVIMVGENPASRVYVENKQKACKALQITSHVHYLQEDTPTPILLELLQDLNHASSIDGILVQLPLPMHIETSKVLELIDPKKDVDGFHPYNMGKLIEGNPILRPCTPYGIIKLLNAYHLSLKGKHVVILGASIIVGRPMALECLLNGATITVCHRFTNDLKQHVEKADVLILATGQYDLVDVSWLHNRQIIIDVGIHRLANGKVHGDIDFERAQDKVAFITPVPRGVGPMTICVLLENTLIAANLCRTIS